MGEITSESLSYKVDETGYDILLNGKPWITQHEPYIPKPELSYEENAKQHIAEILKGQEESEHQVTEQEQLKQDVADIKQQLNPTIDTETCTLEELKTFHNNVLNKQCQDQIYAGTDVTFSSGKVEHFSMTQNDQINIIGLTTMIATGQESVPYHADGEECKIYTAEEATAISNQCLAYKTYHTTYCNLLHCLVNRLETKDDVLGVTYGVSLPEDLDAILVSITGKSTLS